MSSSVVISKPIFIVGMNGSGTTMLLDCLDSHPCLYGFRRETKIIPYFIKSAERYGDLLQDDNFKKMWDDFRHMSFFKYVNNGKEVPLPKDWQKSPRSVAGVIDGTLNYFAQKDGKSRWCEKTPMNAQHISLLASTFPNAKFIHIIRDGRACAASFHRRWGINPELSVYRWKHIVQEARMQGKTIPDRYLEVYYEVLTNNPEPCLQNICRFIQVPYDLRIISLSRIRKHSGSSDAVITKREEYWHTYFSPDRIYAFERVAGKVLHEFGYKTENPDGDKDPDKAHLSYWIIKDGISRGIQIIRQELELRKLGGKWDGFIGRFVNAIRQRLTNRY